MFALMYTSDATADMNKTMLMDILNTAIRFNAQHDITGILLYRDHKFMQLLEGSEETVTELYNSITKDVRHTNCQIIHKQAIAERNIDEWSMGFLHIEDDDLDYQYISFVMKLANHKFQDNSKVLHNSLLKFATNT